MTKLLTIIIIYCYPTINVNFFGYFKKMFCPGGIVNVKALAEGPGRCNMPYKS